MIRQLPFDSPHQTAFTLIEVLVTIAIAAIVLALAAPSFQAMLLNNRIKAKTDGLISTLNYARNTALTQSVGVSVCPVGTLNSTSCGLDWALGWMAIQDASGTPKLLISQQNGPGGITLSSTANVLFDARGLATSPANFSICDSRGTPFGRSVQVLATGFVQVGDTPGVAVWGSPALACP